MVKKTKERQSKDEQLLGQHRANFLQEVNAAAAPFSMLDAKRDEHLQKAVDLSLAYYTFPRELDSVKEGDDQYPVAQQIHKIENNKDKMESQLDDLNIMYSGSNQHEAKLEEIAKLAADSPEIWVPFLRAEIRSIDSDHSPGRNERPAAQVLSKMLDNGQINKNEQIIRKEAKNALLRIT